MEILIKFTIYFHNFMKKYIINIDYKIGANIKKFL